MKKKIGIVTDSTSDITEAIAKELGIAVVPLNVRFGEKSFKDRVEIDSSSFFRMLKEESAPPATSLPSPAEFISVYQELSADCDKIFSIHISSKLSGTYQSAMTAAKEMKGVEIEVIDTGLVSSALLLVVVRAARSLNAGVKADEVLRRIREDAKNARIYFILETMEYLERGGRLGEAADMAAGGLVVKPILTINDGMILPFGKARTKGKAIQKVLETCSENGVKPKIAAVGHATAATDAGSTVETVRYFFKGIEIIETEIGPVIGTHTGPGAIEISVIC